MSILIKAIELKNYRSCKATSFRMHKSLSALIGANGSGKSNILQGILLLKQIPSNDTTKNYDESSLFNCKLSVEFLVDKQLVKYETALQYVTDERNRDDVVSSADKWNFSAITRSEELIAFPLHLVRQMDRYRVRERGRSLQERAGLFFELAELLSNKEFNIPNIKHREAVMAILEEISAFVSSKIKYYSASQFTDPSRCPASFEIESGNFPRILPRIGGAEHWRFLRDLYTMYKLSNDKFNEFISIVGSEGIGLIEEILFSELGVPSSNYKVFSGGRVTQKEIEKTLVVPQVVIRGEKLSFNQLSEGTFRTLAMLFYIMTDKSKLLLIEEPEVCIHHGLLSRVIDIIKSFSRNKQIVISTHSDYVIDELKPENVFIVKNEYDSGTVVEHVPESMSANEYKALKNYLANVGSLGEFWKNGDLERE